MSDLSNYNLLLVLNYYSVTLSHSYWMLYQNYYHNAVIYLFKKKKKKNLKSFIVLLLTRV